MLFFTLQHIADSHIPLLPQNTDLKQYKTTSAVNSVTFFESYATTITP
jgi:hypothetical protein